MKKLFSITLLFVFALTTTYAQDIAKEAKAAKKLINSYSLSKDAAKLGMAKDAIMKLFKNDAANSNFDALMAKGDLYAALSGEDTDARLKASFAGGDQAYESKNGGSSLESVRAYIKAIDYAEKSSQKKSVLTKLTDVHALASQEFSAEYNGESYANAYSAVLGVLESYDALKSNGKASSVITDDSVLETYKLYSGVAAYYGEDIPAATTAMENLASSGSDDPTVYKVLFDIYSKDGKEQKALDALKKGRELEPESKELLFAEIDYLMKKKDNAKVQVLLQEAVERDPENPAIYQALSGVFSDLFKETIDSGASEEGEDYFQKSKTYAEKAFSLDNTYYDAQIILAELHYNKAVVIGQKINALPYDSSKEGERIYNELTSERNDYFQQAIPYCKIAEKIDPNRKLALVFMQEILAATGDLDMSSKIKERVLKIEAGEKFDKSFFN